MGIYFEKVCQYINTIDKYTMKNYFEMLVQNVQKGEMYEVKLKGEPETYLGIPMIPGRFQNLNPPKFIFNVVSPASKKGVYEPFLSEIELLEKKY